MRYISDMVTSPFQSLVLPTKLEDSAPLSIHHKNKYTSKNLFHEVHTSFYFSPGHQNDFQEMVGVILPVVTNSNAIGSTSSATPNPK